MHRLVQQLARERLETSALTGAAVIGLRLGDEVFPVQPWEHQQWRLCARLLAHAIAVTDRNQLPELTHRTTGSVLGRVHTSSLAVGPQRPDLDRTLARGVRGRVRTRPRRGCERAQQLGRPAAGARGTQPARATIKRALAILEAVLGPEHPTVARTLTNLGNVQRELGELEAARTILQRALGIKDAVYGPDHPEVARTLANLGNVQQDMGELQKARATFERALAVEVAVYGPEHPEVAEHAD